MRIISCVYNTCVYHTYIIHAYIIHAYIYIYMYIIVYRLSGSRSLHMHSELFFGKLFLLSPSLAIEVECPCFKCHDYLQNRHTNTHNSCVCEIIYIYIYIERERDVFIYTHIYILYVYIFHTCTYTGKLRSHGWQRGLM